MVYKTIPLLYKTIPKNGYTIKIIKKKNSILNYRSQPQKFFFKNMVSLMSRFKLNL